jgi:hypothetical protein
MRRSISGSIASTLLISWFYLLFELFELLVLFLSEILDVAALPFINVLVLSASPLSAFYLASFSANCFL